MAFRKLKNRSELRAALYKEALVRLGASDPLATSLVVVGSAVVQGKKNAKAKKAAKAKTPAAPKKANSN